MITRDELIKILRDRRSTFQSKYTQLDLSNPDSAYSKGIALRNDYNNKVAAAAAAMVAAKNEYENYGDGKKFAKGTLTDGHLYPDLSEGCCSKTKDLVAAEKALKECYQDVSTVLRYPAYQAKRIAFLNIDVEALKAQFSAIITKFNEILRFLEDPETSIDLINRDIDALNTMTDTVCESKNGAIIRPVVRSSNELGEQVESNYKDLIRNIDSTYDKHVPCHRNPDTIILTIYPDVTKYTDKTTATDGQEVKVNKNVRLSDQDNYRALKNVLNSKTNNSIFKFKNWNGYEESDIRDSTFTEDTSIYGVWNIVPDVRLYIDDVEKVKARLVNGWEFFTDVTEGLNAEWNSFDYSWNASTNAVTPQFSNETIKPDYREWKIKRETKGLTVKVVARTKTENGWGEYVELARSEATVKYLGDYPIANLPINYENAIKSGEFINEPKTKKFKLAEGSHDHKKIMEDTTISVDVIPMYAVRYRDGNENVLKTHNVEIGTSFNIDSSDNKPGGWPARKFTAINGLEYEIEESPNDYSPRGTQTITEDIVVNPQYKQLQTVILTIYPDVTKYTGPVTAEGGQEVEVEKGKKLKDQKNYRLVKSILNSATDNDIFKFTDSWAGHENIENEYFSESLSIYGVWNIVPEITWKVENVDPINQGKKYKWEFFTNVLSGLQSEWDSCQLAWGATTDAITERFSEPQIISPANRVWEIKRGKKEFNVSIVKRNKLTTGWGEYTEVTQTKQTVKSGENYRIDELPTAYMNVIKDNEYISRGPSNSYKYVLVSGSPSYKNIVADTTISVDVTPLHSVKYFDEKDQPIKTYDDLELGSTFDIDSYFHTPSNWPAKQKTVGNLIYELIPSPGDYSPRGVQTINGNIEVKPNYSNEGHYASCGIYIYQRDKQIDGTFGTSALVVADTVDYGKDYRFDAAVSKYYKTLKDGSYREDNVERIVKTEGFPTLDAAKNVTSDVVFCFDKIALFKLEYVNEADVVEKTHPNLDIGWQFDVDNDANKPAGWPKEEYFDNNDLYHELVENNPYSPSGLIPIDSNKRIVPNYTPGEILYLNCTDKCILKDTRSATEQIEGSGFMIECNAASCVIPGVSLTRNFTVRANKIIPDASKTTMNSSFSNFKSEIDNIYGLDDITPDLFSESWKQATKGGKVYTSKLIDKTPEATCYAWAWHDEYYTQFEPYTEEKTKIVYCLPWKYSYKLETGLLGWPNNIQTGDIQTRNNEQYILTSIDGANWKTNGDVKHYARYSKLPRVHYIYGNNAEHPGTEIVDPEQFNPLTCEIFTPPAYEHKEGYTGKWVEANNQGQLTAQVKTLDNPSFFDDLSFHLDYVENPKVYFQYRRGSTHSGSNVSSESGVEISAKTINDVNDPQVDYPTNILCTAMQDYVDDGAAGWNPQDLSQIEKPVRSDLTVYYDYLPLAEAMTSAQLCAESIIQRGTINFYVEPGEPYDDEPQINVISSESWNTYIYKDRIIASDQHTIDFDGNINLPGTSPTEIEDEETHETVLTTWKWKDMATGNLYEPGSTYQVPVYQGDPPTESHLLSENPTGNPRWTMVDKVTGLITETNFIVDVE